MGTFFAFILVCGGILYLDAKGLSRHSKFKVPYVNGKYIIGIALLITMTLVVRAGGLVSGIEEKPLLAFFWLTWAVLAVLAFRQNFSLLPVLGILTNLYLMTELGVSNWLIFVIWLIIGLVIYFLYGYRKSKLAMENNQ